MTVFTIHKIFGRSQTLVQIQELPLEKVVIATTTECKIMTREVKTVVTNL